MSKTGLVVEAAMAARLGGSRSSLDHWLTASDPAPLASHSPCFLGKSTGDKFGSKEEAGGGGRAVGHS